ncbi:sensor histidine kinase [Acidihalobacter prosperus]|uniref:histidine kinase n=1 Tax=Acidihalobacter prosperus TaxID=160660 RepID=A0A1A6C6X4_9GAMM|nr:ATP-binding protein [Acidihalobacter prosperus]OBS10313.1 two-component sensor histidine kinase [Acidihalobacter prosperus]
MEGTIAGLSASIEAIPPELAISEVSNLFLSDALQDILSLPVVLEDGRIAGSISRYQLMRIFFRPYGRELFGKRPVRSFMNTTPLIVALDQSIEQAAQHVTRHITAPVTEDFIVSHEGRYHGIGRVIDLLQAMEARVRRHSQELSQAYGRLKASQGQLIQSEKMASLGQMVAGLAHEINTPLGYVRNNVELVNAALNAAGDAIRALNPDASTGDDADTLDEARRYALAFEQEYGLEDTAGLLEDTLYGVRQISELVSNLKTFSRLDQAKLAAASISECLDSALMIARHLLKDRIEIVKQYDETPLIECSPSQINQVFLNLITNAAQAIDGNGRITLRTYVEESHVVASLQDTGSGMAPELMKRIFDPFFTTKDVGQGTGLGLSISYQIIKQHGGQIRVASKPGKGTRFTIRLPIPTAAANTADGSDRPPMEASHG